MIPTVVTAPSVEPVTLREVKDHLRLEHSDHDTMLESLIQSSREWVESVTGRALVQQTRKAQYREWPRYAFELPYPPLQSVSSVQYTDTGGATSTVDASTYSVVSDREPGLVVLGYSQTWPSAVIHHEEYPIAIEYVCGYEATSDSPPDYRAHVPEQIKAAIKLDVERKYDRPPVDYAERLDKVINDLLAPYRAWWGDV
jgi:uncharacterized phiE125 gp8 family phage protein